MKSFSESNENYEKWLKNSILLFKTPIPMTDDTKDYQFAANKNKFILEKLSAMQESKLGLAKISKMNDIIKLVLTGLLAQDAFLPASAELSLRIKISLMEILEIQKKIEKITPHTKLKPIWFYNLLKNPTAEKRLSDIIQKLDQRIIKR